MPRWALAISHENDTLSLQTSPYRFTLGVDLEWSQQITLYTSLVLLLDIIHFHNTSCIHYENMTLKITLKKQSNTENLENKGYEYR